jgi:DNA polymerase-3 subunit epsilon
MREIIFDTETTGLDPNQDRIIEFGGIELVNRFPTGRTFHVYLNPQGRAINVEAQAVHGISEADLIGKPTFADVSDELFAFIDGAHLVAHNAGFDTAFLNAEFARLGLTSVDPSFIVDTLAIAKRKHPMGPNSLDALCRRYGVDNSHRTKHGALLDSELLAEVYIELIGGKQAALLLEVETEIAVAISEGETIIRRQRERPLAGRLSAAEREAHRAMVEELGADALWRSFDPGYRMAPALSESA